MCVCVMVGVRVWEGEGVAVCVGVREGGDVIVEVGVFELVLVGVKATNLSSLKLLGGLQLANIRKIKTINLCFIV